MFIYTGFSNSGFFNSGDKVISQPLGAERAPVTWFISFRETEEGQSAAPTLAASQIILVQNHQYAIVEYLGAVIPEPQDQQAKVDQGNLSDRLRRVHTSRKIIMKQKEPASLHTKQN